MKQYKDKETQYLQGAGKWVYDKFDLQLFAEEKTEDPTPKRQQETRQKGQVAKSQDLSAVFVLFAAFFALSVLAPYIYFKIADFMIFIFSNAGILFKDTDVNAISVMNLFQDYFLVTWFKATFPIMFAAIIAGLIINYYQVGVLFSTQVLEPKFSKINPISGFSRIFSKQTLVQLIKSIIKIAIATYFIYQFAILKSDIIPMLLGAELETSLKIGGELSLELAYKVLLVLFVLAVLDYIFQKWQHKENIKMTKHEVKEEYKQAEGDPRIKSRIKQKQREMAMRRMMQEIPTATVVVTNPVHLAIALKYEKDLTAPVVVAKGKNFLAERIKEIARENNVAIVENKSLARALYPIVEVGDVIPPELYQAVAEVLAYVFRLKRRHGNSYSAKF